MEKLVKYGDEFIFYISLKTAGSDAYQASPTLAAGDVKVTQDGVDFGNIDTIPVVAPAGGTQIKVTVSVAELTGKQIQIQFIDAAGAEWKADTINISTYGHVDAQYPYFGEGIYDRIISSANHNVTKSAAKFLRSIEEYQGYEGGLIYIDTVNGTAGSDPYVNGKVDKKVNNLADALSLGTALGMNDYHVSAGSSLTFISGQAGRSYEGHNWSLDLNGQAIDGIYLHGAAATGEATAVSTPPKFDDCRLNGTILPPGHYIACGLSSTVLAGATGDYFFTNCESELAGDYPCFDFNAVLGDVNAMFREYRGEIEFKNMGQSGADLASIDGNGRVRMHATSIGGTISVQGHQELVNRTAYIEAGGTVHDASRFATDQLADVSTILSLVEAIDTSTELAARFDEIKGAGWADETLRSIRTAIGSIGGIQGANAITIQIYETDTTTPIVDDTIAIWNSDQSLMLGTAKTDSNGQISIGLDDGTYKIVSQKAHVEFDVPETMIVTVPATFTFYGTPETYPVPSNPDACNVICDLKDFGLDPKAGVTFTARLTTTPQAVSGAILNAEAWSRDTDATGRAILTLPQGVQFVISSDALGGDSKTIRIDTTGVSSIILADKL